MRDGKRTNMSYKIVILTSGYINGRRLAIAFSRLGITFDIVTICYELPKRKKSDSRIRHQIRLILSIIKSFRFLRDIAQMRLPKFPQKPIYAGFCNSKRLKSTLSKLRPDFIFMMGGGILNDEIIGVARKGVLNSHPGLLPWIRGVHVVENAILREIPIGITCHFIDKGIDTGPIIKRYTLPIADTDTIDILREKANILECCVMLETAIKIVNGQEIKGIAQTERFKYCSRLSDSKIEEVKQRIRNNEPLLNLNKWSNRLVESEIEDGSSCIEKYKVYIVD